MEFYSNWILNKSAFGALPCCFCILGNHSPFLPLIYLLYISSVKPSSDGPSSSNPLFFFFRVDLEAGRQVIGCFGYKADHSNYYPSIETVYNLHKDPQRVLFTKLPCKLIHGPFHRCLVTKSIHSLLHSLLFHASYLLSPLWLTSGREREGRRYLSISAWLLFSAL